MSSPIISFTKKEIYFLMAIFISGLILGALLLNIYLSKTIDYYMLENKILMDKLQNSHNKIKKLNKTLDKRKKIIKDITININSNHNEHTKQALKKEILYILENWIGAEIEKINIDLLIKILDKRNIIIGDKNYKVDLLYIIINKQTLISFEIE